MIATILPSSKTFHAVEYNERKVAQGKAELLEMDNFGYIQQGMADVNAASLTKYLTLYSQRSQRIENTQFHAAISCKGNENTPEQLVDIAHQWLKEMGYGEDGQPLLIYAHHDTNNTHIHIVTSRVDPQGHKINDHNERRRSQAILNRIMGVDRKRETKEVVKNAFSYSFATMGQFQAILESSGYECYKDEERAALNVKKDGTVIAQVPVTDIENHCKRMKKDDTEKRRRQLKAILMKYRNLSANKNDLSRTMRKMFGIDIIFNGKKDSPYGYMLVDHKDKVVYKGSDVLPIKQLLQFSENNKRTPENAINYIKATLEEQPDISTFEMSQLLRRRYNAYIKTGEDFTSRDEQKSGILVMAGKDYQVEQDIYEKLRYNGRMKWLQSFHPSSEAEKDVLVKFGHVEEPDKIYVETNVDRKNIDVSLAKINNVITHSEGSVFEAFHQNKLILYRNDNDYYILDMENKAIINLVKEGVDTSMLDKHERGQHIGAKEGTKSTRQQGNRQGLQSSGNISRGLNNVLRPTGGHGANREWEVGNNGRWDDVDDGRQLKR